MVEYHGSENSISNTLAPVLGQWWPISLARLCHGAEGHAVFTSYGLGGIGALVIAFAIMTYCSAVIMEDSYRMQLTSAAVFLLIIVVDVRRADNVYSPFCSFPSLSS